MSMNLENKRNGNEKKVYTAEEILALLQGRQYKSLRNIFKRMEVANISEIFVELDVNADIALFRMLPKIKRAELFSYLPFDRQEEMLEQLPEVISVNLLNDMEPVDRTRLLEDLPEEISNQLILKLNPEERKMAWQLLSYPEESVGRIMSPEFLVIHSGMNVGEAIASIRWNGSKIRESLLHHIFVTDARGVLLGHLSLAALVMADPPTLMVDDLMDRNQEALSVLADESLAVDHFRKYDRPYIPVVDEEGVLVGIVEADDVFDVAEEEATEDIQAFGGQSTLEYSYFQTPFFTLIKKRGGWLGLIFLMSMFSANALENFNETIKTMSFLVFFLPLVIASGGNSGSQAASLVIRGLAVREMEASDWLKVLSRELAVGVALGSFLGALGYWRAVWIGGLDYIAGFTVALSLIIVVCFGATAGAMLPFLLKLFRLDPAVSSSPVISSLVDLFGILVLFNMALYLSSYFL
ncbi:MAG: magnesium transporter [Oligoflexus sp.]